MARQNAVVDPGFKFFSYVYWGEYPLAFAACLGQEECYRLVLAKGADPNGQDTNGNTVLHMLVIYDKPVIQFQTFCKSSFDKSVRIYRRQCLTWRTNWVPC